MKKMTLGITITIIVLILVSINVFIEFHPTFGAKPKHQNMDRLLKSPNYQNGKFQNPEPTIMMAKDSSTGKTMKKFFKGVENDRPSKPIETVTFDKVKFLENINGLNYTWFGHSTVLIHIDGNIIITDPVFSKAASPVPFFNKPFNYKDDYSVTGLPDIDIVLISHDHYDHLDYKTIQKIDSKTKKFYVPLGVDAHLIRWGISEDKIEIADWGDTLKFSSDLNLTAAPARHFSGRGTRDRDKTLWCSWIIESKNHKVFFGGDSGYGKHFKEIGNNHGPFDLTMIECGQYNESWPQIHAMPEQAVQAHADLNGKYFLPIHWSKFRLGIHSWTEPLERATKASTKNNVQIQNPKIGEIVSI